DRAEATAREVEVGRLDRPARGQTIAEREQQSPVLARVGVRDGGDLAGRDRPAWLGKQRRVQRALDHAGFGRRYELRPREVSLEELVGDDEPATVVAVEQMVSAGEPKILHAITPGALG